MSYFGFSKTIFDINKRSAIILAVVGGLLSITLPIGFSLYWTWKHNLEVQAEQTAFITNLVLRRSDDVVSQITHSIYPGLASTAELEPCSPRNIAMMKELDLKSGRVQTVGYVKDNTLICSAYGHENVHLGEPTYVTVKGAKVWTAHEFPFLPGAKFLLVSQKDTGFTAIVLAKTILDVITSDPDISVGLYSLSSKKLLAERGVSEQNWIDHLGNKQQVQFIDGDSFVVIQRSKDYEIAAYAALPVAHVNRDLDEKIIVLVPIVLVAGALLVFAVLSLTRQQFTLASILKGALKRKEFSLHYQPIVDLQTGLWIGAEALIRWHRPAGETIPPHVFIKAAEDADLIQEITEQVIELVGKDAPDFFTHHPDFHIAINLAAADLESPDTIAKLAKLKEITGAGSGNLLVEATERGFLEADVVESVLSSIRKMGIHVAIDDFGTGYSNLSYLETFELDCLKIDKSFVDTLGKDSATSQVVPHIIEMAKSLKLVLIAEGVETEEQAQYLRDHGVQYAQGWLFAKAMPFTELVAGLATSNPPSNQTA